MCEEINAVSIRNCYLLTLFPHVLPGPPDFRESGTVNPAIDARYSGNYDVAE